MSQEEEYYEDQYSEGGEEGSEEGSEEGESGEEGEGEGEDEEKFDEEVPAVPPIDYEGTKSGWVWELASRGYHPKSQFSRDIVLSPEDYHSVLDKCERKK
eukprot:GHVU01047130.1.p3 GENE.GHVU01047130.1~~GHVU01047130.1.p3  ORF type:complete len:100 (-),score=24.70 GHVU01047130.1:1037-1336(-)